MLYKLRNLQKLQFSMTAILFLLQKVGSLKDQPEKKLPTFHIKNNQH
jgi:hypothetical protein